MHARQFIWCVFYGGVYMFSVNGLNHITIFVQDLERSLQFYTEVLRMQLIRKGDDYAYLESGRTWFCISQQIKDPFQPDQLGVHHMALSVDAADFDEALAHLQSHNVTIVREPITRGIGKAVNFLDPDGLQWEFHTSNLAERMTVIEEMEANKS